jgi:GNAT superfamily N-acetyltransferase
MALEISKDLTQAEQFEAAAKFAGVPATVLRGIWRTESAEGKNMLSAAGAEGHFQIMPVTRKTWEGRVGRKLDPYDFTDGLTLAALTLRENLQATKGNVPDALRMYNAGPDRSRWNNEETRAYASKVLGTDADTAMSTSEYDVRPTGFERPDADAAWNTSAYDLMSVTNKDASGATNKEFLSDVEKGIIAQTGVEAATVAAVAGTDGSAAALEARDAVRPNVTAVTNAAIEQLGTVPVGTGDGDSGWEAILDQATTAEAEQADADAITFGDKFGAAFDNNTLTAGLMHFLEKSAGPTSRPDANWNYLDNIEEVEQDRSEDEIDELREARSAGEVGLIKARQNQERESNRVLTTGSSTGAVVGYTLAAGVADPVGWVAGFGVGKVFQIAGAGSRAAFNAGNTARGFALAGSEGAVGNVLTTAALDAAGMHQSSYDYAASAGFGMLIGSGLGGLEWRGAARTQAQREFADMADRLDQSAAQMNAQLYQAASAEAGPTATPEEIATIATRINAEQEQRIMDVVLGDVDDSMRLFPRPDATATPPLPQQKIVPNEFLYTAKSGDEITFKVLDEDLAGTKVKRVIVVDPTTGEAAVDSLGRPVGNLIFNEAGSESATSLGVRVSPEYQRQGIATAMYKIANEQYGADLGDAKTGVFGEGRVSNRTTEGQALRENMDMDKVEVKPRTVASAELPKIDSLPGSILNTRKKRKAAYARYGLDVSIADDAERKIVGEMFARAERVLGENPVDVTRLKPLLSKVGWEATSTRMLLSDNPVMRAFAVVALENPEGAAGRKVTAAMTKAMRERVYLGNTLRDYDNAYTVWRNRQGGSTLRDFHDTTLRRRFDKEVYAERDRRWNDKAGQEIDPEIKLAADHLDAGYRRMGMDQDYIGTIGSARIDYNKAGYQPRRFAPGVVAQLNDAQRKAMTKALSSEFQATAGFDKEFSDQFAIKYIERINTKAKGAYDVPANLHSDDAADIVRDSLRALSMNEEQIAKVMGRFSRGGASHTKGRIDADLTTLYEDGAGGSMQLLDMVNTNNIELFRSYARRVSGEVSLAKYGIMGEQGLKELRMAMTVGPDGMRASSKELEAFDQVAAEFLGRPFGDQLGKWADNARSFTSALRLGGMGFNQFNEYANGVAGLGVMRSFKALAALPRLMGEVRAMKQGKPASNTLLGSMELYGGDFGMDGYRMQGMYDVNEGFEVYGTEALTVFDKAIRAGAHGNRVLSGHRAITAVQIRGMSEQIVQKSLRYIRDGKEDVALDDMGITAAVRDAMRKDINKVAKFGPGGEVLSFDITKLSDNAAAHAYMVAVNRGASQIIQDTYIGETGKWAHDGWLKLMTQFRSYSITATQKQWRRQSYTHGTARALGYLLGAMSVAAPIHMARVQLRAAGRPDREEFLDKELSPLAFGRSTMNYVASAGLLPDLLDITSSMTGGQLTGGRSGNTTPFVGGQIVPAAGAVNDVWKAAQTRDPHRMVKLLPGSNLPYLQAAINQLDE